MKRKLKAIITTFCATALTACAFMLSGCGLVDKFEQLTCEHDYGAQATKIITEATCVKEGKGVYTCRHCRKETEKKIPKLEHEYNGGEVILEATCTKEGKKVYTCLNCATEKEETIKKTEHTRKDVELVSPTCTKAGMTAYAYCTVCNGFIIPKKEIPALGHSPIADKGVAATCTTDGLTLGEHCSLCDEVLKAQEVIPAKGHVVVTDKALSATCTTDGLTAGSHCSACNTAFVAQTVIKAYGHEYDNDQDSTCNRCGEHRHTAVVDEAVAAGCTTTGLTEGSHCSTCLAVLVRQEETPATGHDMGDDGVCKSCGQEHTHTVVSQEAVGPTCTEPGLSAYTYCSDCGKVILTQEVIPAKGHTEVTDEAVAASCTATGLTEGKHCMECGETIVAQELIPITHTYDDEKVCTLCGYEYFTPNLQWQLSGAGDRYELLGRGTATDTELYIPATYNGLPVTIDSAAFLNDVSVKKVFIRSNERLSTASTIIKQEAFSGCTALQTVVFDGAVYLASNTVRGYQFAGCTALETFVMRGDIDLTHSSSQTSPALFSGAATTKGLTVIIEKTSMPEIPYEIKGLSKETFNFFEGVTIKKVIVPNETVRNKISYDLNMLNKNCWWYCNINSSDVEIAA